MKNYIKTNKNKIFIYIGIMIGVIILLMPDHSEHLELEHEASTVAPQMMKELSLEDKINRVLSINEDTISFAALTFQIDKNLLLNKLKENYDVLNFLDNNENFDRILYDYLINLEEEEKELFGNEKNTDNQNKEYIVNLIKYFTSIYSDVDFKTAAGIANVESGYVSERMLKKNNIFGGLYNGRLIDYKSIEYGTLKYIKLLNDGYYNKGLNTVELIGRVYNPTKNDDGIKIAKPAWVNNVVSAMEQFNDVAEVDASMLIYAKNS